MRFSANLSMLFRDAPFLERFERAARAGFDAVEFWWPREPPDEVVAAAESAGVSVVLFNFDGGDVAAGERGLLSDPATADRFRANVPRALELAERLGCPRLNALVGKELGPGARERQLSLAVENVAWAADQAAGQGAEILIEALNTFDNGPCLISSTRSAANLIARVERPNVKLQYDAFHMQRMEGNLVATITAHLDQIAHIQIADSPGRGEPGTGEINFGFVLAAIDSLGYDGHVGLEYNPTTAVTEDSLGWLSGDPAA